MFGEGANSYLPPADALDSQENHYNENPYDPFSYFLPDDVLQVWDDPPIQSSLDLPSLGNQEDLNTWVYENPIPVIDGGGQGLTGSVPVVPVMPVMPVIPVLPAAAQKPRDKRKRKRVYPKKCDVEGADYAYWNDPRCLEIMNAYRWGYGQELRGNNVSEFFRKAKKVLGKPMVKYGARYPGSAWKWVSELDWLSYQRLRKFAESGGKEQV